MTHDTPDVAVVIVNFNSGRQLADLLDDTHQQQGVRVHVTVVDNGSADGSVASARRCGHDFALVTSGRNLGYAGGANLGVASSPDTEYVMLLNPDLRFRDPTTIRHLIDLLRSAPGFAAVAPTIIVGDTGLVEYQSSEIHLARAVAVHTTTHQPRWAPVAPPVVEMPWIDGAALLLRRGAWTASGGFDERFFLYQEEVDWCVRVRAAGWSVGVTPDVAVLHWRSSSFRGTTKATYYYWRNLYFLCQKHAPGRVRWRLYWAGRLTRFALAPRNLRTGHLPRALNAARDSILGRGGPVKDDSPAENHSPAQC